MIVLVLPLIRVGTRIRGCKQFEDKSFINLLIFPDESNFSRSILKSPIRKISYNFPFKVFPKED